MSADRLTRGKVANALSLSVSQVRRLEDEGVLHPWIGPDAVRRFDPLEVDELRRRRQSHSSGGLAGSTVAQVFTMLDEGAGVVEIVKRLELHPKPVEELQESWARHRRSHVLNSEDMNAIEELAKSMGISPFRWDTDLVTSYRELVAESQRNMSRAIRIGIGTAVDAFFEGGDASSLKELLCELEAQTDLRKADHVARLSCACSPKPWTYGEQSKRRCRPAPRATRRPADRSLAATFPRLK